MRVSVMSWVFVSGESKGFQLERLVSQKEKKKKKENCWGNDLNNPYPVSLS